MRAMRDDRIRRDLLMTFKQQSRLYSYGAIVVALVIAWAGLGWAWSNTDALRSTYQAAIIEHQNQEPKSLRQKGNELMSFGKNAAADKTEQFKQKLDERREHNEQKQSDVINEIRRRRGE
jgi:gas vesicle protein